MVGFYKSLLVGLGLLSVANSSLIDLDLDLDLDLGLGHGNEGCSNPAQRKEWGELTPAQRIEYTDAVLCLQKKPQHIPRAEYPGVRNRFDDFVATHINYTLNVHYSGFFLPWHRHFLTLWETALQEECGYSGSVPYWDWPKWERDLAGSPLFDCSESSLSGDGEYSPDEQGLSAPGVSIPRGSGGGCVRCGPFKDMQIHMGPFARNLQDTSKIPAPGFDYNPRCFTRSLNNFVGSHYNNMTIVDRLLAATDIVDFLTVMDHWPAKPNGVLGVHGGGHFSLGATLQDLFASPQDPAFMLHHAMIDRLWAIWQSKDAKNRNALNGTDTILNPPTAKIVTLDTDMEFGVLDRPRSVGRSMNPTQNGYCYSYT